MGSPRFFNASTIGQCLILVSGASVHSPQKGVGAFAHDWFGMGYANDQPNASFCRVRLCDDDLLDVIRGRFNCIVPHLWQRFCCLFGANPYQRSKCKYYQSALVTAGNDSASHRFYLANPAWTRYLYATTRRCDPFQRCKTLRFRAHMMSLYSNPEPPQT